MNRRSLLLLLIVTSVPTLPLCCVPLAAIVNTVNPMQIAFLTSFTVENRLGHEIRITPIGACGPEGDRATLPQFQSRSLGVRANEQRDLRIGPGEVRTVVYDWDDINFSEILVRTDEWHKVLIVDSAPTKNQYHSPEVTKFVIDGSTVLVEPSSQVLEAAKPRGERSTWGLTAIGVIGPLVFLLAVKRYRRHGHAGHPVGCVTATGDVGRS